MIYISFYFYVICCRFTGNLLCHASALSLDLPSSGKPCLLLQAFTKRLWDICCDLASQLLYGHFSGIYAGNRKESTCKKMDSRCFCPPDFPAAHPDKTWGFCLKITAAKSFLPLDCPAWAVFLYHADHCLSCRYKQGENQGTEKSGKIYSFCLLFSADCPGSYPPLSGIISDTL